MDSMSWGTMIAASIPIYEALLTACNVHGEVSIAKEVAKKVLETGVRHNIYAASGRREEAVEMHTYIAADLSHPQFEALCSVVTDLGNKMRTNMTTEAAGYEFVCHALCLVIHGIQLAGGSYAYSCPMDQRGVPSSCSCVLCININPNAAYSVALQSVGMKRGTYLVSLGALKGMTTVLLVGD
ncbi:hypothetical protein Bca4012_017696 [Brassica carinata]